MGPAVLKLEKAGVILPAQSPAVWPRQKPGGSRQMAAKSLPDTGSLHPEGQLGGLPDVAIKLLA